MLINAALLQSELMSGPQCHFSRLKQAHHLHNIQYSEAVLRFFLNADEITFKFLFLKVISTHFTGLEKETLIKSYPVLFQLKLVNQFY